MYDIDESDFILFGQVDEAIRRAEVIDIFIDGRICALDLALDSRSFEIVQAVLEVVVEEVFEGVFHHEEVYLGDFLDLNRKDTVDLGD